jgi:hypothetical protein
MNSEELLIQALKQKERIVVGRTIGTDVNGNCTVQGSDGSVLARSEGNISAGDCVALKADDGQWYAVSARETGTVAKKTLYSRRNKVSSQDGGRVIVLFNKDNALYVGGDRDEPELVYELEAGYVFFGSQKISKTGSGSQDYILNFIVRSSSDTAGTFIFCSIAGGTLRSRTVAIPEGLGTYAFQHDYFNNVVIEVEDTSVPPTPPIPPSDPLCFLTPFGGSYIYPYLFVRTDYPVSGFPPGSEVIAYVVSTIPISTFLTDATLSGYFTVDGVVYPSYPLTLPFNVAEHGLWTEIDCRYTETSPTLVTSTSIHKSYYVDIDADTDQSIFIDLSYSDPSIGVSGPPVTDILPIPILPEKDVLATQSLQRLIAFSESSPFCVGIGKESAIIRTIDSLSPASDYVFHDLSRSQFLSSDSFVTPPDLVSEGSPLNGQDIALFLSPNLVGSTIYSVHPSSFSFGNEADVVVTEIGTSTSFSVLTLTYRGITDDFTSSIVDASAYPS